MQIQKSDDRCDSFPKIFYLLLFFLFWAFYVLTCCKDVGWIDSGLHVKCAYGLNFGAWVNRHNLFYLLARLWTYLVPVGEFAYRVNLFCSFCGACTVFFIFLSALEITGNRLASLWGACAVLLSHSLWWHSTITEVYTLNTALLSLVVYCLARFNSTRRVETLYAASFFFGLACSNHVLMWLFIFPFLALLYLPQEKKVLRQGKTLMLMLLFFLAGFQLYLIIFIKEFNTALLKLDTPTPSYSQVFSTFAKSVHEATGGHFKKFMFPKYAFSPIGSLIVYLRWHLNYLLLLVINYPSAALAFGFVGFFAFWKKQERRFVFWFVSLGLIVNSVWAVNYHIWDQYAFALPTWVLFGLFVAVGLDYLWKRLKAFRLVIILAMTTILLGPYLYASIPRWSKQPGFWKNYFEYFHYSSNLWDAAEYFANPNKRDYRLTTSVARAIFNKLPQGAVLYDSDGKGSYPLMLYFRDIYKLRDDIEYVAIFGPTMTEEEGRKDAERIITQIDEDKEVFISSLYWPEWVAIRHLYFITEDKTSREDFEEAYFLKPEELIKRIKRYRFKPIPLIEGEPYRIYKIEKANQ